MAVATIKMPDEFLSNLSDLKNKTDEIIESMLKQGSTPVVAAMRGSLNAVIGKGRSNGVGSTGELADSLGVSPVAVDNRGISNVKVGFSEPRRKQNAAKGKRSYNVRTNAMIANILEHGVAGRQPPRPFMKAARRASENQCVQAMKAEFERQVSSL